MPEFRRADIIAGALTAAVLTVVWPAVSQAWLALLRPLALAAAGGGAASGPTGASVVLPLALGLLVALPIDARRKLRFSATMVGVTLGAELVLVVVGAALHMSPAFMTVAAGAVQNIAPLAVLLAAVAPMRRA